MGAGRNLQSISMVVLIVKMETSDRQLLPNYVLVTSSSEKPLKAPIRSQFDWKLISLWDWNPRAGCLPGAEPQPGSVCEWYRCPGRKLPMEWAAGFMGRQAPPPRAGTHYWLHLGCFCFVTVVELLAINKPVWASYRNHLAWNEIPSVAHQNWRGLQICFLFALVDVHVAEKLTKYRLGLWFLAHRGTERKDRYPDCQGDCQRPEFGGKQIVEWPPGDRKGGLRPFIGAPGELWIWVLCGSWSGLTSLPGGGLGRNLLL